MARRMIYVSGSLLLAACGCLGEPGLSLVPSSTLGTNNSGVSSQDVTKALKAGLTNDPEAQRIMTVGAKILQANPKLGLQPMFLPVLVEHEEVFHQGLTTVYITECLSKRCKTEGELAAVLCMELSKMAEERDRLLPTQRTAPPPDVPVGNDYRPGFGGPDLTRQMELYKNDMARRPATPPKPEVLAKVLLTTAGYELKDLDSVTAILRDAEDHVSVEKTVTGKGTAEGMPLR